MELFFSSDVGHLGLFRPRLRSDEGLDMHDGDTVRMQGDWYDYDKYTYTTHFLSIVR